MDPLDNDILSDLTDAQRAAVTHVEGPLLVLAGAGSGKTRVITRRVAWLMAHGIAGRNILAVTFTNKAANEMKQRIDALLAARPAGDWVSPPTVCTFHSFAARTLRIHHQRAGLKADFTIYDQADRVRAVRLAIERVGLSPDNFQPARVESVISGQKNRLRSPEQFAAEAANFIDRRHAEIYTAYERVLAESAALDFDDLLFRLARMLQRDPVFRQEMADRYQYTLIDEYQDTNLAQYQIARDLARPRNNLCATGDPDQSIYGWRGADLNNILKFEHDFPGATVVRLEQNYRSTKRILAAADGLIQHNVRRKHKRLWTENLEGDKVVVARCADPHAEATLLADRIEGALADGFEYRQMAVFMRLNALTRVLEDAFRRRHIPYQIARGVAFYGRKEIKDATSYLRLMVNPADRVALERVINTPSRGIGQTTVDRLIELADASGTDLWQACRQVASTAAASSPAGGTAIGGRAAAVVGKFVRLIEGMAARSAEAGGVQQAVEIVLRDSGLEELYRADESASANLGELVTAAGQFDQERGFGGTLADWLNEVALVSDVDSLDAGLGAVTLMTLHAAKGLEFPVVFIVGCETGLIPHVREDRVADVEEERRLLFVGITRAQRRLTLTHVAERMLHGRTIRPGPSPFLAELPAEVVEAEDLAGEVGDPAYQPGWAARRGWSAGPARWRPRTDLDEAGADRVRDGETAGRPIGRADVEAMRRAEQAAAEQRTGWAVGTLVRHAKFGVGRVVRVTPSGGYTKATIDFRNGGLKAVIMEVAPIERVLG